MLQLTESVVDWKVFAAWLETEGTISSIIAKVKSRVGDWNTHKRDYELAVYQAEKRPLEILRDFLLRSGVSDVRMFLDQRTGVWHLKLTRIRDIELVIRNVEPYLLTKNKKEQLEKFRRFRSERFKRIPRVIDTHGA